MPVGGFRSNAVQTLLQPIAGLLRTGDEHATIDRLFESQHVRDLQVIIVLSTSVFLLIVGVGTGLVVVRAMQEHKPWYDAALTCLKYGGPVVVFFASLISSSLISNGLSASKLRSFTRSMLFSFEEAITLLVERLGPYPRS